MWRHPDTLPPEDGYRARLYGGEVVDGDGDGIFDVRVNLCDSSRADAPDVHEYDRWNGTTSVRQS